jgi:hypothetical protein
MRQAAIYGAMTVRTPILLRTRQGIAYVLARPELAFVQDLARATLALKQAQTMRRLVPPAKSEEAWPRTLIAIDTETDTQTGDLLEIGAVVFDALSGQVLNVYHFLDPAVEEQHYDVDNPSITHGACNSSQDMEYYGFSKIHRERLRPQQSVERFRNWVEKHCPLAARVNYAGNDSVCLGGDGWINMHQIFRGWLSNHGIERNGFSSLADAVEQLMGDNALFVPHRAFEDAVALAMVTYLLYPRSIR